MRLKRAERRQQAHSSTGAGARPSVDASIGDGLSWQWGTGRAQREGIAQPNRDLLATSRAAAAVTAARSYYALIATATVDGPTWATEAITPRVLDMIATDLLHAGETTWLITHTGTGISLIHLPKPTITGKTLDGSDWRIVAYASTPSGQRTIKAGWADVMHIVHAPSPHRPWQGQGIIPALEGRIAWTAGLNASDRLAAPHGIIQHLHLDQEYPKAAGEGQRRQLAQDHPAHNGQLDVLISDRRWQLQLLPFGDFNNSVNEAMDALAHASIAIRDAAGIPAALMPGEQVHQPGATREALSAFVLTRLEPLASLIAEEASDKLGATIKLDLSHLRTAESAGNARAIKALVGAGMSLDDAMHLVGLGEEEGEA